MLWRFLETKCLKTGARQNDGEVCMRNKTTMHSVRAMHSEFGVYTFNPTFLDVLQDPKLKSRDALKKDDSDLGQRHSSTRQGETVRCRDCVSRATSRAALVAMLLPGASLR